jgi:mutator protein MutT
MDIKAAVIILYNGDKRVLLQHRTEDAKLFPGYWAFFGGAIKVKETPEEAVCREAFEELNYILSSPEFFTKLEIGLDNGKGEVFIFIKQFNGQESTLRLQEGQNWGWFTYDEATNLNMLSHDLAILKSLAEHLWENEK